MDAAFAETIETATLGTCDASSVEPDASAVGVSIVMPCLNEIQSLPHCITNAKDALGLIAARYGLTGEIVVADNGSTDGSQGLAVRLGARVALVDERGYGAALIGGAKAARGRYILMGDCDGSYDFTEGAAMIGALIDGSAVCMGSRFAGGIAPGAMPWKNRWIGNPALTGVLNLFFRTGIDDAHCGLRALTKEAFEALDLRGTGMEFASEMVIKAALRGLPMTQVPATLSADLRDRAPHLRPWRDGWRHLRYLLMLSPPWVFGVPALVMVAASCVLLGIAGLDAMGTLSAPWLGDYWTLLGTALLGIGHTCGLMAIVGTIAGVRGGYARPGRAYRAMRKVVTLETMIAAALTLVAAGGVVLTTVVADWAGRDFGQAASVAPVAFGTLLLTLGMQSLFGGFLMAIVGGHEASFLRVPDARGSARAS